MFPFCDVSYSTIEDFDCVPNTSCGILESDGWLDSMWLFLNTKIWYVDSQLPTHELDFEFSNV
jgi:hypothetical protein